jgi:alkanesulfonate monooxygenase SsuD/methylene tetrahydromethanopterin reductase-like flavin-dependent oxidoreductase (luciferase family)
MLANKSITPHTIGDQEYDKKRRYFAANAIGGYPFVGTPDRVAEELATSLKKTPPSLPSPTRGGGSNRDTRPLKLDTAWLPPFKGDEVQSRFINRTEVRP